MTKKMIVIGPVAHWQSMRKQIPAVEGIEFVDFADLSALNFKVGCPDFILSALVGPTFDVLDVARLLQAAGFTGAYRAVTEGLLSPAVVLAEVAAVAPSLDFDVVIFPRRSDA